MTNAFTIPDKSSIKLPKPKRYQRNMRPIILPGSSKNLPPKMMNECKPNCDYSKAVLMSRATWCCAKCGRDFSIEYLFWHEAVHPEQRRKK